MIARIKLLMAAILLMGISTGASALSIPNPNPIDLDPDVNRSGLFLPQDVSVSIEITDVPEFLGLADSEFGFFFSSNPGTLIPLFEIDDQSTVGDQVVVIDFLAGTIFDVDQNVGQGLFAATPNTSIGFYMQLNDPDLLIAFGAGPLFTLALLNAGGEDNAAEFPVKGDPFAHLIQFAAVDLDGVQFNLGSYLVAGISPVPVPAAIWLFGTALIGLLGFNRRKRT